MFQRESVIVSSKGEFETLYVIRKRSSLGTGSFMLNNFLIQAGGKEKPN